MKKKIIISISIIAAVFILGIGAGALMLSGNGVSVSTGRALISENGTCFLIKQNSPIRLSDYSGSENRIPDLENGDKIFVIHSGINESYPASTGVYFCKKTADGKIEDIPEEVISSLKNLGWLSEAFAEDDPVNIAFKEKYIRTGTPAYPLDEEIDFPLLTAVNTVEEFKTYTENNKENYALGDNFFKETEEYTEEFFRDHTLFICFIEEGSGSYSHDVREVLVNDTVNIFIDTIKPEAGTCDMAYHHIMISVKKSDIEGKTAKLMFNKTDKASDGSPVFIEKDFANFSLTLPENWSYEEVFSEDGNYFGISVFNGADKENNFTLEFDRLFGVCGTGLRTEPVIINGYNAHMGIYDANPTFDYIVFENTPGYYVIKNNADTLWWQTNREELTEIIGSIKIAQGIIFREEAVKTASEAAEGEYQRKAVEFDFIKGIWEITFVKDETEQAVKVDSRGNIVK